MKKNILFIVIASLIIGFTACQKDEATSTKTQNISEADLQTAQKITSFLERMRSPSLLKSQELISLDDAVWNMEAALNYLYANIPEEYGDVIADSSTNIVALQLSSESFTESEIANIFDMLLDIMNAYYENNENKMIAVDLSTTFDGSNVLFSLYFANADTENAANTNYFPFNESWRPAMAYQCYGGKCVINGNSHTHTDLCNDLSTKIQQKINSRLAMQARGYFTDIEYKNIYGHEGPYNPDDDVYGDNYRDYLIYCTYARCTGGHCNSEWPNGCYNYSACLDAAECNFYYNSTYNVLSKKSSEYQYGICPENKQLISVTDARGDIMPNELNALVDHYFAAKYGVPHAYGPIIIEN